MIDLPTLYALLSMKDPSAPVLSLYNEWLRREIEATAVDKELTGLHDLCDRVIAAERYGPEAMAHVALTLWLAARHPPLTTVEYAWEVFRAWRCHGDGAEGAPFTRPPEPEPHGLVIELMLLPGDAVRVAVHHGGEHVHGVCIGTAVGQASALQGSFQDALGDLYGRRQSPSEVLADYASLCLRAAKQWSDLLLDRPIAWSSGASRSLAEVFDELQPRAVTIAPHGPTWTVPWLLLRHGSDELWWGERYALSVLPSARRHHSRLPVKRLPCVGAVDVFDCEDARSLLAAVARFAVPHVTLHGRFGTDSDASTTDPFASTMSDLSGTRCWSLKDLLKASGGVTMSDRVLLHVCESGEAIRHAVVADGVLLASPFLAAGAREVVCWWARVTAQERPAILSLLDPLHVRLHSENSAAEALRATVQPMLARWRRAEREGSIDTLHTEVIQSRDEGALASLHDLAFLCVLRRPEA